MEHTYIQFNLHTKKENVSQKLGCKRAETKFKKFDK